MRHSILPLVAIVALGGCQTWGPSWSEISGIRYYNLTELNRSPTIIENVDGRTQVPRGYTRSVWVEPGKHTLRLQGIPLRAGWQGQIKDFTIDVEPCKRYYVNAQFEGPLQPSDWKPVIDYVEPISGCGAGGMK